MKIDNRQSDVFLPKIIISEELFDANMTWLANAIRESKILRVKDCLINTLLYLQKQRVEWRQMQQTNNKLLDDLLLKYST